MLKLYNSLTKTIEAFTPLSPPDVSLYTCGMTVYDYAHIGHGRKYVGDDILRRILTAAGYRVNHVQNVTDVGHLVSDGDEGEDKLEKGARKAGKTVWEVAQYFTEHFYDSMDALNILRPNVICKATDHIAEQIALIERLMARGLAYETPEAVYYDIGKFPDYDRLFPQLLSEKQTAVREDVRTGEHKRNPRDFALWFKRVGRFADHAMHWDSPWGDGFPGWHIECSAMSMKYLGETIDIHTGGIDHLSVHHPNEIAQSEGATGKPFVRYWVHHGFLMVDGRKMSKSLGNIYTIEDIHKRGYDPLALRYLYLTAHYRKPLNFTFESLTASQNSLSDLRNRIAENAESAVHGTNDQQLMQEFSSAIHDDMNMPEALAALQKISKTLRGNALRTAVEEIDAVLGLGLLSKRSTEDIPDDILSLKREFETLREQKNYSASDTVREKMTAAGYEVRVTPDGTMIRKK